MIEFVCGTDEQYLALDTKLDDNLCHVFHDCMLPENAKPSIARLGFEKTDTGDYIAYIDKGIDYTFDDEPHESFKAFLSNGKMVFEDINSMAWFFRSLKDLFNIHEDENVNNAVVNKDVVREIISMDEQIELHPEDIAEGLKEHIFGQDEVIDNLAEQIAINRISKTSRLLAISFLGPTATGKSETAKKLAEVLTRVSGSKYGYLEIAGSEFIGEHTVHRLFGAPPGYIGHGKPTLFEPVRQNPRHVIVINEIEKADDKLLTGLMEAIDTGRLEMADNTRAIDLSHVILLFTSNIPIDMNKYEQMSEFDRVEMCRDVFTDHCKRPEISGKIGNFLVFKELNDEAIIEIIIKYIEEELQNYDLRLNHVEEELVASLMRKRTKYGARGIRILIRDSVGRFLLNNRSVRTMKGNAVDVKGVINDIRFEMVNS